MNFVWIAIIVTVFCQQCHETDAVEANCMAAGKYPNNLKDDCTSFSMCIRVLNNITRVDLYCPKDSIYSHIENQCTNITSYRCLPKYNCTDVGDFPNSNVSDCSSYISCADGVGGIVTARLSDCPPGTLFDPVERFCVNSTMYQCVVPTTEPPQVFQVSVKVPDRVTVTSVNSACFKKVDYVMFIVFLIVSLFN